MHQALHPRDDISRLYVSRIEGERGSVDASIWRLKDFMRKSKEILITAASYISDNIRAKRTTIKSRKQKWKEKNSLDISSNKGTKSYTRKRGRGYEKETLKEKLNLFWWQHKTIPWKPKWKFIIRNRIASGELRCDKDETFNHISECCKWAQKKYKTRQDWLDKVIHSEPCTNFKFDHTTKWYIHKPEYVLENKAP